MDTKRGDEYRYSETLRRQRRVRRALGAIVLSGAALLATACSGGGEAPVRPTPISSPSPEWNTPNTDMPPLMVRHGTPAETWVAQHPRDPRAPAIETIAEQPTALWLNREDEGVFKSLQSNVEQAQTEDRTLVVTLYNIFDRDCGGYSKGGTTDLESYKAWIDKVAAIIGDTHVILIAEPDMLPLLDSAQCNRDPDHFAGPDAANREEKMEALQYAVQVLTGNPNANVYIDAGTARQPGHIAALLEQAGIDKADGFVLNVSNYYSNEDNIARARWIATQLGHDMHFIFDTSRNGVTSIPYTGIATAGNPQPWCDPSHRALGDDPQFVGQVFDVGSYKATLDAKVWGKFPGNGDGCKRDARYFYPDTATELVTNRK